jgi:hypothetical protein
MSNVADLNQVRTAHTHVLDGELTTGTGNGGVFRAGWLVRSNNGCSDKRLIGSAFYNAVDCRGGNLGEELACHENKREQKEDSLKHSSFDFRLQRNGKFQVKYKQISSFGLVK